MNIAILVALKDRLYVQGPRGRLPLAAATLGAVFRLSNAYPISLCVLDWASTDGVWDYLGWLRNNLKYAPPVMYRRHKAPGFNRGAARNQLTAMAEAVRPTHLLYLDADVVPTARAMDRLVQLRPMDVWFPTCRRQMDPNGHKSREMRHAYGLMGCHADTVPHLPAWPEYDGWGGEDLEMFERVRDDINRHCLREYTPELFTHLWHPNDLTWKNQA